MSDMMKQFVSQELSSQIRDNYPHMQYPAFLQARVAAVRGAPGRYEAVLKILDKYGRPDSRFPEVPKVFTDIEICRDDVVAVALLYGELNPYIIGRCM